MRKRQPANSSAAAAAGAPDRGRSQFRRESRARLNPREAGREPGEGPVCRKVWTSDGGLAAHQTRTQRDGGRHGTRLCPSQTFRPKSELSPGHEESQEAGSRDIGGQGCMRVCAGAPPPAQATPTGACLLPQRLRGGMGLGGWEGPGLYGWLRPRGLLLDERRRPTPPAYWRARADAAPHWSVLIWAPNSKILKVPAGAF